MNGKISKTSRAAYKSSTRRPKVSNIRFRDMSTEEKTLREKGIAGYRKDKSVNYSNNKYSAPSNFSSPFILQRLKNGYTNPPHPRQDSKTL